jgi:hypothetical protein
LGKPYGIKLRCYWKLLREQIGNLGNLKEHDENSLGTRKKKKRKLSPSHPQKEEIGPIMSTY